MRRDRPPPLSRRLLGMIVAPEIRDETLEDLDRIWEERRATDGPGAADRWYRRQLVSALVPAAASGLSSLLRDVSHTGRQLRRHPAVGIVVVATLSVGIGATTAIFSAVDGVLVEPLPYERPSELVMVTSRMAGASSHRHVSGPDAMEMQETLSSVGELAGFGEATVGPLTRVDRPEHVLVVPMTWNLFQTLGVEVALGRIPDADDGVASSTDTAEPPPNAAVISHAFWERSFGGDPGVIGEVVHIWGGGTEIVGVLPRGFQVTMPPELNVPPHADVWETMRIDIRAWPREGRWLRTVARLAEQVSPSHAQREVDAFAHRLREIHPHHAVEETEFRITPLEAAANAHLRGPLWLLMAAVLLVLMIACANAANLLLARGAARAEEMAIRSSLGAGAGRLVRQLLTESALLAGLGAIGGILLALTGIEMLHAFRPDALHRLEAVRLNPRGLAFTVAVAGAATVLCGILPALQAARSSAGTRLRTRFETRGGHRWRAGLVVFEVALSVILLFGAGLLIRSFGELQRVPLGFEPEGVLTVTVTQPLRPPAERQTYEAELLRAASSVPGVTSAGIVFPLPMNGVYERTAEWAVRGPERDPSTWSAAYFRTVSPTYFEVMGIELRRGRSFAEEDEDRDAPVVILDERLAADAFPHGNPLGETLRVRGMGADTVHARVVGVVEHAPQGDHLDQRATMYFPRTLYQSHEVSLVAKIAGNPADMALPLRAAVRSVDPSFPSDVAPMEHFVRERLARSRFLLVLMQTFGAVALLLSAVGLYGVLSYTVRQRSREIGLRLAIGARTSRVVGEVVRSGLRLAVIGCGIGLLAALALGQVLEAHLFRVGAGDPRALSGTAAVVLLVAAMASLLPALRAARVDPSETLRSD